MNLVKELPTRKRGSCVEVAGEGEVAGPVFQHSSGISL